MTEKWFVYRCTGCGVEQSVPAWLVAKRYRWVPVHYAANDRDICGRMLRVDPVAGARNHEPPQGWFPFGHHVDIPGPLEFSADQDEAGMPLWERPVQPE